MKARAKGLIFVGFAAAIFATSAMADTATDAKTVTSKLFVENYAQPIADKTGVQVVYKASGGSPEWQLLAANGGTGNQPGSGLGYVSMKSSTASNVTTRTLDIATDRIAASRSAIATGGTATGDGADAAKTKLTTAKAVYDFVTAAGGNYQPKIDNTNDYNKVMIGYNKRTGSGSEQDPYVYDSNWQVLGAGTYVQATSNGTATTIDIKSGQLATGATGLVNADSSTGAVTALTNANKVKLVEAQAVQALVAYESSVGTTTITSAASGNGKVPTVKNVYDFVISQTGGNQIPPMSAECQAAITASTQGNHCALVASWDATLNNNAGGIVLEWTLIAQPA